VDWGAEYHHSERPAQALTLKERTFRVQASATSKPVLAAGALVRFATAVEAGTQQSTGGLENPAPVFIPNANVASWKNAVGVTLRLGRESFSASYGVQVSSTRRHRLADYMKHVVDAAYDLRATSPRGWLAHRPLDVRVRASAGRLTGSHHVPLNERFVGGNVETPFLVAEGWTIRGSPLLRSYPAYSFGGLGRGGDSFWSVNLSASLPVWVKPLVPSEVANDPAVRSAIDGQLDAAGVALESTYRTEEPAYRDVLTSLPEIGAMLRALQTRLNAIEPTLSTDLRESCSACAAEVDDLLEQLDGLAPGMQLGWLVSDPASGDVSIPSVLAACIERFNVRAADASVEKSGRELAAASERTRDRLARIDVARARRQAARDMAFPRQVVGSIFDEMNLVSAGPVALLDAAHLGQRHPTRAGITRYGVGVGLRLSVASTFHLTGGYSWNPGHHAGEPPGAGFVVVEVSAPFGW
jgi:hypothetical protein